jgi:hypothetical protein
MQTSIVVGMGIGQLYKSVLEKLGYSVITVDRDPAKEADFTNIESAVKAHGIFHTAHICTPNYTHFDMATVAAANSKIVFVEKPGVADSMEWQSLVDSFPNTRFMMVKNNMWRDNLEEMRSHVAHSESIKFKWINKNRIPGPGTWFTTKELAYGGVSRDLMPHLLSLYIALNEDWQAGHITGSESRQIHKLENIQDTEYGIVNRDGIYNVDDLCKIKFMSQHKIWKLEANWADGKDDNRAIEFESSDGVIKRFELGLCPESAYEDMIKECVSNIDDDSFWSAQLTKDLWIHERIESL